MHSSVGIGNQTTLPSPDSPSNALSSRGLAGQWFRRQTGSVEEGAYEYRFIGGMQLTCPPAGGAHPASQSPSEARPS